MQVHIRLRIGNRDTIGIERFFTIFNQVKVYAPVITTVDPGACRYIDRGVTQV